ncbi:secreted protein, partial [gut metagenome]
MSKILKRILSSFLVMAMIIATVPVKVMASSEEQKSSTTLLLN